MEDFLCHFTSTCRLQGYLVGDPITDEGEEYITSVAYLLGIGAIPPELFVVFLFLLQYNMVPTLFWVMIIHEICGFIFSISDRHSRVGSAGKSSFPINVR